MTDEQDRILPGVMLMLGFCLTAPMIDVFAKLSTDALSVGQVTLARFTLQALLMLPLVWLMRLPLGLSRRAGALVALRAAVALLFTSSFVAAVTAMPIADALTIVFVAPFILMLLGRFLFGEEVGMRRILASLAGFVGAMFVIQPSLLALGVVALLPLATAVFFAFYLLITRRLSRIMHPVTMQSHTALAAVLMLAPVMWLAAGTGLEPLRWVPPPSGEYWLWLAGVGLAATVSHLSITYALRFAPSATLAPLQYLEIPTAVVAGYLVFADFPTPLTWAGIGIIISSGLYVIHRERINSRIQAKPPAPAR